MQVQTIGVQMPTIYPQTKILVGITLPFQITDLEACYIAQVKLVDYCKTMYCQN